MRTSVLLADEDPFELLTLGSALRLHGVTVVGEAKSQEMAENLILKLAPDVVVADISHDGANVVNLCHKFRRTIPTVGIVLITNSPDLRLLGIDYKTLPTGALVILKKALADLTALCRAIEESVASVLAGEQTRWAIAPQEIGKKTRESNIQELTDSQVQILRLVVEGFSNAQIGRIRFVSEKAVEQMITRIAQQLSIRYDRSINLRACLVSEYYKSIGAGEK